jgi:DNA-binding Lrp family transcriptional regulator
MFNMVFMVEAYIFVNSDPRMLWKIAESALKIEGVKMAHAVTGQFDVVAYAEFANMNVLREIIDKFQSLTGVQRTQTVVVIPPRLE